MPKHGENIHKRKDGRWEGRYKNGKGANGKTKYASVYGKTYTEVKKKLAECTQKPKNQTISANREISFKAALLLWKETNKHKHKGSTEVKYTYLIEKHILPELGNYKLSEINSLIIADFMNNKLQNGRIDKKGGLAPSYVRTIMLIISEVLEFAVYERLCDPIHVKINKPSVSKSELRILTHEEQKRLERVLLEDIDETKLGILLSLHTGLRISEVCALTWNDIDLTTGVIHLRFTVSRVKNEAKDDSSKTKLVITNPKTKSSSRDIPIAEHLLDLLKMMHGKRKSKYVVSVKDEFISPRTYEHRFHKLLDKAGISQINYHALRHTFATRCIEVGIDVKTLSEILGHATVSITLNTYVHSSMDRKREQMEKLKFYF